MEKAYSSVEEATGDKPDGCPWASLSSPFVSEVLRARGWREHGQLEHRYPDGVPNVIVDAIDVYDAAYNATQVHDLREDRKKRDAEIEAARLANGG